MALETLNLQNKYISESTADQLEIIFYTDPLCCWSWAMEPQLRRIQYEYEGKINWRYCMGGMIPSWNNYHDEINSVSRPLQMGPVWMHAQYVSGMAMDSNIWMKDAPASSYPACIAFKNASLQSNEAGIRYLRLVREAVMLHGKNISRENVLLEIARELSKEEQFNFNLNHFEREMSRSNAMEAFRSDLQEVQHQQIKRFPTFIIKNNLHKGIIITGYRPYEVLVEAVMHIAPGMKKNIAAIDEGEYQQFWGFLTDKEMEIVTE